MGISIISVESVNSELTLTVLAGGVVFGSGIRREDREVNGPTRTPVVESQPVVNEGTKDISCDSIATICRDVRVDRPEGD